MNSNNYLASWNAVLAPEIDPNFFNKDFDQSDNIIPYFSDLFNNQSNEDLYYQKAKSKLKYENNNEENIMENQSNEDNVINDKQKIDRAKQITSKSQIFSNNKEFVTTMNQSYKRALAKYGFNSNLSLMLVAQDALESGWGKKPSGDYNYGGITTRGNDWHKQTGSHKWKDFKSIDDYTDWKVQYLSRKFNFYNFASMNNIQSSMQQLANKGYCPGSPQYGSKVASAYNHILRNNYV